MKNAGVWSNEEDEQLIRSVVAQKRDVSGGSVCWRSVSEEVGSKSPDQCAFRWCNTVGYRSNGSTYRMGPWSKEEDEQLIAAVEQHSNSSGSVSWGDVSESMGEKRTRVQCNQRWNTVLKFRQPEGTQQSTTWTVEEVDKLKEGVQLYRHASKKGSTDWQRVSEHLQGARNPSQCRRKYNRLLEVDGCHKNNGPWTEEEDEALVEAVSLYKGKTSHGNIAWAEVCKHLGNVRTIDQCWRRWHNVLVYKHTDVALATMETDYRARKRARLHLTDKGDSLSLPSNSEVKKGIWTEEEDELLVDSVEKCGGEEDGIVKWSDVVELMNGQRNVKQCYTRWQILRCKATPSWSKEEDARLIEGHAKSCDMDSRKSTTFWRRVADHLGGGRRHTECRQRWKIVGQDNYHSSPSASRSTETEVNSPFGAHELKSSTQAWAEKSTGNDKVRSGVWTTEEDQALADAVKRAMGLGPSNGINWSMVTELVPSRTLKQCYNRWEVVKYRTTGDRQVGPWTPDEDKKLTDAFALYGGGDGRDGTPWALVSDHMGGTRTPVQCKRRWARIGKKVPYVSTIAVAPVNSPNPPHHENEHVGDGILVMQGQTIAEVEL